MTAERSLIERESQMNGRCGEGEELERSLTLCLYQEAKSQKDDHGAGRRGSGLRGQQQV